MSIPWTSSKCPASAWVSQVKVGQQVLFEHVLDRRPVGGVVQGLKPQVAATEGLGKAVGQHTQGAPQWLGDEQQSTVALPQLFAQKVQCSRTGFRTLPADGLQDAVNPAHGPGQTVGVV